MRLIKLLSVNLLITCILILSLEGLARLFPVEGMHTLFEDKNNVFDSLSFVSKHSIRGFSLIPGYSDGFTRINSQGFRGDEISDASSEGGLIIALGESTTFGWNVKNGEDYPSHLNTLINESLNAQVINAGVPSYTTSQVLLYLKELLGRYEPDLVLISIMWNDIILSSVMNWSPALLVKKNNSTLTNFLITYSEMYRRIVSLRRKKMESTVNTPNQQALDKYVENLYAMIALCKEKDVDIVFVKPPFASDHLPDEQLIGVQGKYGGKYTKEYFLHLADIYETALVKLANMNNNHVINHRLSSEFGNKSELFIDFAHPDAIGNYYMAQDIYRYIKENKILN